MINGKRVLAVIPARSGSKGLPRKNIKMLHGRPLLGWPVLAAKNSEFVDRIIVSTDSEEFSAIAREQGAEVPFLRPEKLSGDTAKSVDVVLHTLTFLHEHGEMFSYVVLLEPTSPMTDSLDVDAALKRLENDKNGAVSIVGVSRVEATHPAFDVKMDVHGGETDYCHIKAD